MCDLKYKGYRGTIDYCEQEQLFYGKVIGIKDLISYEGETIDELLEDFHEAVDQYISDLKKGTEFPG